jgi:hypothetical protein
MPEQHPRASEVRLHHDGDLCGIRVERGLRSEHADRENDDIEPATALLERTRNHRGVRLEISSVDYIDRPGPAPVPLERRQSAIETRTIPAEQVRLHRRVGCEPAHDREPDLRCAPDEQH